MRQTIFTEEEASHKICPLTIQRSVATGAGPCVGSFCMAWEWVIEAAVPEGEKNVYDITPRNMIKPVKVERGYCGYSNGDKNG